MRLLTRCKAESFERRSPEPESVESLAVCSSSLPISPESLGLRLDALLAFKLRSASALLDIDPLCIR